MPSGAHGHAGASSSQGREFLAGVLERELEFTESMLQRAPRNEAALNYLRGLFALPGSRAHAMGRCEMVGCFHNRDCML